MSSPRRKYQAAKWEFRNVATGQVIDADLVLRQSGTRERWVKLYQDGKLALLRKHPELRGQALRVLHYLESVVTWGNVLPSSGKAAQELGILRPHSSRAYSELVEAGFILKREGAYYLSPRVGWKGTEEQLGQALRLWYPGDYLALPAPAEYVQAPSGHAMKERRRVYRGN